MHRVKIPLDRGPIRLLGLGDYRLTLLDGRHGGAALLVESEMRLMWCFVGKPERKRKTRLAKREGVDLG